jgi:hypothetical protein
VQETSVSISRAFIYYTSYLSTGTPQVDALDGDSADREGGGKRK